MVGARPAGQEHDRRPQNYLIADIEGKGHYVGCNLSVTNFQSTSWWGEGDDMIFVDGEPFPPCLHGTGSEDYSTPPGRRTSCSSIRTSATRA